VTAAALFGALICMAVISGLEAGRGDWVPLAVFALLYGAIVLLTEDWGKGSDA
jgi:hypothetical protein